MTFDASGQRVLVTGASSGIGAALAEAFASAGATVGISALVARTELLEVLGRCQVHTPGSRHWVVDLADPAAVDRLAVDAVAELGGVDILVNNAGIPLRRHVTRLDTSRRSSPRWRWRNYLSPIRLHARPPPRHGRATGREDRERVLGRRHPQLSARRGRLTTPPRRPSPPSASRWPSTCGTPGVTVLTVYPGLFATEAHRCAGQRAGRRVDRAGSACRSSSTPCSTPSSGGRRRSTPRRGSARVARQQGRRRRRLPGRHRRLPAQARAARLTPDHLQVVPSLGTLLSPQRGRR